MEVPDDREGVLAFQWELNTDAEDLLVDTIHRVKAVGLSISNLRKLVPGESGGSGLDIAGLEELGRQILQGSALGHLPDNGGPGHGQEPPDPDDVDPDGG